MEDGSFRFDRLLPKGHNLATGSASTGFAVRTGVSPGDKDVVLRLRPGGRVRALVLDQRGTPVAKAWVRVVGVDGVKTLVPAAGGETDAMGAAEVASPAGLVALEATQASRRGEATIEVSPGSTATVRILLSEAPSGR